MWSRIYLIPALTAEEDRDLVRRHYADLKREKELLGGNTSAYNTDRYGTPDVRARALHVRVERRTDISQICSPNIRSHT
jgi:hypothetical protein